MIYSHSVGQGPDIVLLHGWGLNAEVWHSVVERLQQNYRVTVIDLPGHGRSVDAKVEYSLDVLAQALMDIIPDNSVLLGWSMGGLIAQKIALRYPEKVGKLILMACNAQFVQSNDWPFAMKPEVLNMFVENLLSDYKATLQRFLMLQARGGDNTRDTIRELKQRLYAHGEPDTQALYGGLQLLKNSRFVDQLPDISVPVLLILGRLDALVPCKAGQAMAEKIENVELHIFDKSAHAPFISHLDDFLDVLESFIQN